MTGRRNFYIKTIAVDMTGHLVHQTTNETQINISQLSNGIYIVRVFDAENYYTTRLVIEH